MTAKTAISPGLNFIADPDSLALKFALCCYDWFTDVLLPIAVAGRMTKPPSIPWLLRKSVYQPREALIEWTYASIFAQQPRLSLVKLEAAVYPPMAVAARVYGEVVLNVKLASDRSANVVTVESGPPMLRQAAINSATRSQFEVNLENRTGGYRLVYRFVLDQTTKCEHDDSYPRVKHEENVVTITEQNVPICDPAAVIVGVRFRSAKCLYLWKCGC